MKLIYVAGVFALTFAFGCNNQPKKEQVKVVEKETVREVQVEAPPKPVKVVEQERGTSVKIGPDGGSLRTKKVDIDINN